MKIAGRMNNSFRHYIFCSVCKGNRETGNLLSKVSVYNATLPLSIPYGRGKTVVKFSTKRESPWTVLPTENTIYRPRSFFFLASKSSWEITPMSRSSLNFFSSSAAEKAGTTDAAGATGTAEAVRFFSANSSSR